jgi:hypothetical protein
VKDGKVAGAFQPTGVWYLAGGNTCVYSNPKAALGETKHVVQTSNRRFRDNGLLISRKLTSGQSEVRIRDRFTPVPIPLFRAAAQEGQFTIDGPGGIGESCGSPWQ